MVIFRNFIIFFALIIPTIPTGIPIKNIRPLPKIAISHKVSNKELEFKTFVGVVPLQIIRGINNTSINSDTKIILSNILLFSFISNAIHLSNSNLFAQLYHKNPEKAITPVDSVSTGFSQCGSPNWTRTSDPLV